MTHDGREQGREKVDVEREASDDDHDISGHGADMSCSSIMSRRLVPCDDAPYIPLPTPAGETASVAATTTMPATLVFMYSRSYKRVLPVI